MAISVTEVLGTSFEGGRLYVCGRSELNEQFDEIVAGIDVDVLQPSRL
jgi:hypothetical protein